MDVQTLQGVAWEDLSVVLAAFEHRSLNRAAAALRIGQSTASRRLARLEDRLGAHLFDRTPEGLAPTAFAMDLEPIARLIQGHMADITRLAHGQEMQPRGRVRLALPDGIASSWLLPHLATFYADCPEVDVDLVIGHAVVDLVRREADMAVRFIRPTQPDLVVRKLGHLAIAPYAHASIAESPLEEMRWIVFDDPEENLLETQWVTAEVGPQRTMRVSLWNALFAAVQQGLGAGLLSPLVAEPAGLVRVGADREPVQGRDVYLVYHRALRDVPRIAAFREWLGRSVLAFLEGSPL
ncbi:MAG: LysR family transcriptional regulator [Deltaproteobacteria bacterium]|nr:LysR family transcriptional regulator [Deltaproteobacteria bacterium]